MCFNHYTASGGPMSNPFGTKEMGAGARATPCFQVVGEQRCRIVPAPPVSESEWPSVNLSGSAHFLSVFWYPAGIENTESEIELVEKFEDSICISNNAPPAGEAPP